MKTGFLLLLAFLLCGLFAAGLPHGGGHASPTPHAGCAQTAREASQSAAETQIKSVELHAEAQDAARNICHELAAHACCTSAALPVEDAAFFRVAETESPLTALASAAPTPRYGPFRPPLASLS